MPPPLQSDEMIRRMCPQNHPPPLTKLYNIAPSTTPRYLEVLPSLKPAPYNVVSPAIMNDMAKSLIPSRTSNVKALMKAQEEVLNIYSKPVNKLAMSEVEKAEDLPQGIPLPAFKTPAYDSSYKMQDVRPMTFPPRVLPRGQKQEVDVAPYLRGSHLPQ